ncbi:hypothetical protein ACWN8P_04570 [Vagococcus salmoninarum]|uniref:Uncharacterized protein n=1 Tax=Vagococcus salmoninarum TaxID=2739 RepID=A0A429ZSW1_9ENTE|nr:hypothetical protein [Vagococcus salmoninarum]RST96766.1 hypothetical protein CBF35_04125 [Vagococcus salmoninarum]
MSEPFKLYVVTKETHKNQLSLINSLNNWGILGQLLGINQVYHLKIDNHESDLSFSQFTDFLNKKEFEFESRIVLTLKNQQEELSYVYSNQTSHQRFLLIEETYVTNQNLLEDYVNQLMEKTGSYAFIRPLAEFLSHNLQTFQERQLENLDFPKELPVMYDQNHQEIVDTSQLSGYDYQLEELTFTSCWQMWYTRDYFQVIPKKVFLDLQQVTSVSAISEKTVKVVLYSDPHLWQHSQNIKFQFLFRDQLGFDHLEWRNGVGVMREAYTEFTTFNNGTQMIQFQNSSLQPTTKLKARHFTTRLFNGPTNQYVEGRRYGVLNENAYFPWRDEKNKQLIAYWTINPIYMLDSGLKAFEFYIKQYIEVFNQQMINSEYQGVLRFYLPGEALSNLPLEQLKERHHMKKLSELTGAKEKISLLLPLTQKGLIIEFLKIEELADSKGAKAQQSPNQSLLSKIKKRFSK